MGLRILRAIAVMVVAFAIGLAFAPLRAPELRAGPATPVLPVPAPPTKACGLAVIDAWHAKQPSSWFGYTPLTSVPAFERSGCRAAAQNRLRTSEIVLLVGVFLALFTYANGPLRREHAA
jgi:hypothetical protein